ncbi:MAG: elongation factor G [Parasporobacterium sp.]|nr:elongation factor G [Parasporobacterium sp.]
MNVYKTESIRNVVFLGHGGSGKTTLAESMAFSTGIINRMGNITDGNTISDFDKEEIKRKFSISTTVIPIEFKGYKINVIDTPGYFDFIGAAEEGLSVADGAVIVVNAKSGLEVGAIKSWGYCKKNNIPVMFFISGLDDANADFDKVVADIKLQFGSAVIPVNVPIGSGPDFKGFSDAADAKAYLYNADGSLTECEIPDMNKAGCERIRSQILEDVVASVSEELMEKILMGEEVSEEEVIGAIKVSVTEGDMVPVIIGAPIKNFGAHPLIDCIIKFFPSPSESPVVKTGKNVKTDADFTAECDPAAPLAAYVFKTIMDPFIGKYSVVKVLSGVLTSDDTVFNADTDESEKISKLYIMRGNKFEEIKELQAGDIGAIGKLNLAKTGDTLSKKDAPIIIEKYPMSKPYTFMKYSAVNKGEEDKISQALTKLAAEDQTIKVVADEENRQALIYGIGDQQLDVIVSKMKEKYKVEVVLEKPAFPFRETIRKSAEVEGKHKKQSGGHGQYGHVKMIFEPIGDTEQVYQFEEKIFGGSVPKNYFPAVEKGIQECVQKGPLASYPVVGVKATLTDGSYHPVDSSEMAFKMATILAFKKGFMDAGPVLLEPIASLKVYVPDKFTGDVMGDLNKKRGRVLGMNPTDDGRTCIEADIPQSELFGYSTDLRSMTGGFGDFEYEFARYEQAPSDVQQKEIAARQSKDDE